MKVLMTGFDPFGNEKVNPAYQAVELLGEIKNIEVVKLEIPTVFYESRDVLKAAIDQHQPDIVICVGQAGGRSHVSIERVAVNIDDARIPDNKGQQPIDEKIQEKGPSAYFSNLPIKAMADAIKKAGLPGHVSNSAGTYVCNHIMYQLMHLINQSYPNIKGGFIHVPFSEAQVADKEGVSSMHLASIAEALRLAIIAAVETQVDLKETAGSIC